MRKALTSLLVLSFLCVSTTYAGNGKELSLTKNNKDCFSSFKTTPDTRYFSSPTINWGDFFNVDNIWTGFAGYFHQAHYPGGFYIGNLMFGFGNGEQIVISNSEYREPTWSIHWSVIGFKFGKKAIWIRPSLSMGLNIAKKYTLNSTTNVYEPDKTPYFGISPMLKANVYMFNFFAGYEFVPAFKELNGWFYGFGMSLPVSSILNM